MKTLISGLSEDQVADLSDSLVGTEGTSKESVFDKLRLVVNDCDKFVYSEVLHDTSNFIQTCIACGTFTKVDCLDVDYICDSCNQEDICNVCNKHELDCMCGDIHGFEDDDFDDEINDEMKDWEGDEEW